MPLPTVAEVKDWLDGIDPSDTEADARLGVLLDAAVELVQRRLKPEFLPLAEHITPALRVALLEFVRDMYASGSGPRGVSADGEPVYSFGRPLLSPYIASLLDGYIQADIPGPVGVFPSAVCWPFSDGRRW